MKQICIGIFLLLLTLNVNVANSQKLKGSDTVLPLIQKASESYLNLNPNTNLIVTGGGSGVGITGLIDGTTDLAMASRKIKFNEKLKLKQAGKTAVEFIVAYDALAVIIHPSNPIKQLSREQLESIFTGKVTNWKDLGGTDSKIVAYSRESSSGTYEFFKENVLKNKNYMPAILSMPATGAIIQSVSQTKGAIAYVGLAYLNNQVKALAVSYDGGKTYVGPSFQSAKNKTYPIVRALYLYYNKSDSLKTKHFLDFLRSGEGKKIVEEKGYISL